MFRARANPTLTFALCASLVVHALVLLSFLYWYVHRPTTVLRVATAPDTSRAAIIVDLPPPPPPPKSKSQAEPPKPPKPEPPKQFQHTAPPPLRDDSGEANGVGTANRSSPGETPMQAQHGLEQAKLSRNPKQMPDDSATGLDTPPAAPRESPLANVPEPTAVGVPSNDAAALPVPEPEKHPTLIAVADPTQAALLPPKLPPKSPPKPAAARPTVPQPLKKPEAQPGRASDTDSMAFSKANNVTFRDGKVQGRQGRRVRTTHIAFGLAAEGDAASLADPRVVLGVTVDATGNVQNVIVLHSSGSDNIDSPVQTAVYNWWFEPLKDAAGKPQPDVWVVTIE